jgi:hypothetical protein
MATRVKLQFSYIVAALGYMTGVYILSASEGTIGPSSVLFTKALHVPLFAGVAGCLLLAVTGGQWYRRMSIRAYALVGFIAIALAAAGEWRQSFVIGRIGSVYDVLLDGVGIGLAIVIHALIAHRMHGRQATAA